MAGGDGFIYKRVEEQDDLIKKEILPRLEVVEAVQVKSKSKIDEIKSVVSFLKSDIASIRYAQGSLEFTVLKDGAQTRDILLNRFVDHYLDTDGKKMVPSEKITLTKLETKEEVWLAIIAGFTGSLATIAPIVINWINK